MFAKIWDLLKDTVSDFMADEALSRAAGIAYFTIFPIAANATTPRPPNKERFAFHRAGCGALALSGSVAVSSFGPSALQCFTRSPAVVRRHRPFARRFRR
jgi:hypothetical protein